MIPDQETCMMPFLEFISDNKEHKLSEVVEMISDKFHLTKEERNKLLPKSKTKVKVIDNRVGWARTYLNKAGLLEIPKRGSFRITERGRSVLAENPEKITKKYLEERFPEFKEFLERNKEKQLDQDSPMPFSDEEETEADEDAKATKFDPSHPFADEIKLLGYKKNIILQGAPGTGKTYSTASIALGLVGADVDYSDRAAVMKKYEECRKAGQIEFVTFHQSMDYEDFVEGIKTELVESGEGNQSVNYKIEDGIFKRICENAEKAQSVSSDNFEQSWDKLVEDLNEKDFLDIPLLSGKKNFRAELNEYGDGLATRTYENDDYKKGEWIRGGSKFYSKDQLYNVYKGLPGIPSRGHDNYRKAIIEYCKKNFGLVEYSVTKKDGNETERPFVLIIDEINRGNVSKIFGELITLLEADKRAGGDHPISVALPYSKELFAVPQNLYVIGTMNTTDRSVGSIDYAIRRRFAFVTLKSNEDAVRQYYANEEMADDELCDKVCKLFDEIRAFLAGRKIDMDIDDVMVGHSYFMAKDFEALKMKFEHEIMPLVREYAKDEIISASSSELDVAEKEWREILE